MNQQELRANKFKKDFEINFGRKLTSDEQYIIDFMNNEAYEMGKAEILNKLDKDGKYMYRPSMSFEMSRKNDNE